MVAGRLAPRGLIFLLVLGTSLHTDGHGDPAHPESAPHGEGATQTCVQTDNVFNCSGLALDAFPARVPTYCTVLDLGRNHLRTLPGDLVLDALLTLSLHDNHIASTEGVSFQEQFPKLLELDLSGNRLSHAPVHLPVGLRKLDLDRNRLEDVDVGGLETLEELYLQENLVSGSVPLCSLLRGGRACRSTLPLRTLALSHNHITDLPEDGLTGLQALRVLSLKHNRIKSLQKDAFRGAPSLTLLELSGNQISVVDADTFRFLPSLRFLYLSGNRLGAVPPGLPLLEWLDVSHNAIRSLNETLKAWLYPIELVHLGHNPWHCDCHLVWVKEWYDRRDYILQYSDTIPPDDYVPTCASPPPLAGERWSMLADDMFVCSRDEDSVEDGGDPGGVNRGSGELREGDNFNRELREGDRELREGDNFNRELREGDRELREGDNFNRELREGDGELREGDNFNRELREGDRELDPFLVPGDNPKYIQTYGLHVQVRAVTPTSVTLEWHAPPQHTNLVIQYFVQTAEVETTLFSQVQAAQGHFVLRNLEADSDYTICILPKTETLSLSAPLQDCIRVRTQPDAAGAPRGFLDGMLSFRMDHTLESKFKLIFGCFFVSVVIVASGLLLAEGVLRLWPQAADKEHDD